MGRRVLLSLVAIVGIAAPVLLVGPTASAAESPGPGYVQGVQFSTLANIPPVIQKRGVTGWSIPLFDDSGFDGATNWLVAEGAVGRDSSVNSREFTAYLGEPYQVSNQLRFPLTMTGIVDNRTGVADTALTYNKPRETGLRPQAAVYCSSTEWALPAQIVARDVGYGGLNGVDKTLKSRLHSVSLDATATNCAYIMRIELPITYVANNSGIAQTDWFVWRYSQFLDGRNSGFLGGEDYLCNQPGANDKYAECKWITRDVDGGDFAQVCAGAPQAEWLSFEWLGPWIGHYAKCLFVPLNGLDRTNALGTSWTDSAVADLQQTVITAIDNFNVVGGCGFLFSGNAPFLGEISFDTCGWNTWAGPVKAAIGLFLWLGFGWWAVQFLHSTFTGLYTHNDFKILAESQKGD